MSTRRVLPLVVVLVLFALAPAYADGGKHYGPHFSGFQAKFGSIFMLFRDADGDGIPNGLDPDWFRPLDGTGYQDRHQSGGSVAAADPIRNQYRYRYSYSYDGKQYLQFRIREQYRYQVRINQPVE